MATKKSLKKSSAVSRPKFAKPSKAAKGVNFRDLAAKRKAARGKDKAVQLPDGFRVVGRAPNHDFDKHPIIEGERGPVKTVVLNADTKNEKETRCFVLITEELGAVTVWESAGLRDLFDDTEDGDYIRIEHTETLAPRKKGQQGMRVFSCAVRE